ncbi:MAG: sigma-70 family RNA polymerase sigma factor [Acidobacteria bacterium]|nr:sigma-70 family RNA polymerase sigma factor [Acidobacteriota bacterium]
MDPQPITLLLQKVGQGDKGSESALLELVYSELHRLASSYMRRERKDHTLQPSALVNEAYVKLIGAQDVPWQNRGHFYAAAARVMRNILIDYARTRAAERRGGAPVRAPLREDMLMVEEDPDRFLLLDAAMDRLEQLDPRQAKVVELRFYGGLNVEETAAALDISEKTVKRDWAVARAWLEAEIAGPAAPRE